MCNQDLYNLTDEQLVEFVFENPNIYSILMHRHKRYLFNFINAHLIKDQDQVEDIVQEAFVKAYINLNKFDISKKWKTWLYTIAINCAYTYLRKPQTESLEVCAYFLATANNPEKLVEIELQKEKIASAIFGLEPKHKIILELYYNQELNYEEIGKILNLSKSAVRSRLDIALRCLRISLGC